MKILFIVGAGVISSGCVQAALQRGCEPGLVHVPPTAILRANVDSGASV